VSVAWATVALLVFLLPGFVFLSGLTFPERFTRETAPSSPLAQLAIVVSIAFFVHAAAFVALGAACRGALPCPRTDYLLATFQLQGSERIPLAELGRNYEHFGGWILAYVLWVVAASFLLGLATGHAVVADRFGLGRLARHAWVYNLAVGSEEDGYTIAYVLTRLRQEERVVLYKGVLHAFGLGHDGRFQYLVLYQPERFYLQLRTDGPTIAERAYSVSTPDREMPAEWEDASYFVINGEEMVNTFFKRYSIRVTEEGLRELEEALDEEDPLLSA
jgi:hypothetical protein